MHLTVKSTKKMAFSSHQSEKKAELVSRLSTILRKKTAEQVRLPIRMALSPPKSCSVDKWKYILLPSNHKAPLESVCLPGELMFYFHAARAFTVCIPAGSRTVRPLHAFAGAGPHLHSPESGRTAESLWRSGRRKLHWPLSFCCQPFAACGLMRISTNCRRTVATSARVAVPLGSNLFPFFPARMPACCMDLTASFAQLLMFALSAKVTAFKVWGRS